MKPNRTKKLVLGKRNWKTTILLPGLKSHELVRIQLPKKPLDLFELSEFSQVLERAIFEASKMAHDLTLRRQAARMEALK